MRPIGPRTLRGGRPGVGALSVIEQTRIAYDRMIQIVFITSKLDSIALSHHI